MTLEEAIDRLYSVDLAEFVPERTRLVKELRAEGRRAEAQQVAELRKPTTAAWAVNQLARKHRRDVDLLLDAGHRLREAQAEVLRTRKAGEFERARATERDALRRLTREADELLGGASASTLAQIGETLRAAAVSEEGREQLALGRLATTLEPEGFDVLGGLAPAKPPARRARQAPKRSEEKAAQEALRAARERQRELEREARAAVKDADTLERRSTKAKEKADAARAEAEEAAKAVEEAERRLRS